MHPRLAEMLAAARLEDDHSALPQPQEERVLADTEILIRLARPGDRDEIAGWGEVPVGPVVVAVVDGALAAAASVGGEELVADPARPVDEAAELLELRARQLGPG